MSELNFEKVDQIQAATGKDHYYRAFQIDEGWILYIHPCGSDGIFVHGMSVGASSYENAQAFAQAYEDSTADLASVRMTEASRAVYATTHEDWNGGWNRYE